MAPILDIRQEEPAGNVGSFRAAKGPRTASRPRSLMGRRGRTSRSRSIPASVCGVATLAAAHVKLGDPDTAKANVANIAADASLAAIFSPGMQQDAGALSDSDIEEVLSIGPDDDDEERAVRDVVKEKIASLHNDLYSLGSIGHLPWAPHLRGTDMLLGNCTSQHRSPQQIGADMPSPSLPHQDEEVVAMNNVLCEQSLAETAETKESALLGGSCHTVVAGRGAALWDARGMRATRIKRTGHSSCSILPSAPKASGDIGATSREAAKVSAAAPPSLPRHRPRPVMLQTTTIEGSEMSTTCSVLPSTPKTSSGVSATSRAATKVFGVPPCLPKQRPRPAMLQTATVEGSEMSAPSPRLSQPVGTPLNACRSMRMLTVEGHPEESNEPHEKEDSVAGPSLARSCQSLPSLKVSQMRSKTLAGVQSEGPQSGW